MKKPKAAPQQVSLLSPAAAEDRKPLLPIYDAPSVFAGGIEQTVPIVRDSKCRRCSLGMAAKNPCLVGAVGDSSAPLFVGESPTQHDDLTGGASREGIGGMLLSAIAKVYDGPLRIVWALGCPAGRDADENMLTACRPYLAGEFDSRPPRAIVMGPLAVEAVTGIRFNPLMTRKGVAIVRGVPCYFIAAPGQVAHNRIHRRSFESDVAWALASPAARPRAGSVRVALSQADALAFLGELRPADGPVSVDVEDNSNLKNDSMTVWTHPDFKVICVGFCQDPDRPFVLPQDIAYLPEVQDAMRAVLEDPRFGKIGHWIQHDRHALWRAFHTDVRGIEADTILLARLMESDAPAGLGSLQWRVGLGGAKKGAHDEAEDVG